MVITAIQLGIRERSKAEALEHAAEWLNRAKGSDLVLLPEMWPVGYFSFSQYVVRAESIAGPTVKFLARIAREIRAHVFTGSFVEKCGGRFYNTSLLLGPDGGIVARYRKIHLFGFQSDEKRILTPGTRVSISSPPWGLTGMATCYDLRFPELFRKMVDRGAQFFLIASAWPAARREAWVLFNRARAHENLAYLFACNCAGSDQGRDYAGHSMFVNPAGEVIAELGTEEGLLTAEIAPALVGETRQKFSVLADRVMK